MRKAIVLTFFLFVSFGVTFIHAQENAGEATSGVVLDGTESFPMTSSQGYDYLISISLPYSYQNTDLSYPVLYLLDPSLIFATTSELVHFLAPNELPALIVVGIGYPGEDQRDRDYDHEDQTFLNFISDELMPLIDSRYRTNPDERAIAGFSLGGSFALYTLGSKPELFNRYIVMSPGRPHDFSDILNGTDEDFRSFISERPTRLYISKGTREGITTGSRLAQQNYEGLELTTFEVENATHELSVFPALINGIIAVYCGANEDPISCGRRVRDGE
jgi:predicted alpha/beta superfamily hydrolase